MSLSKVLVVGADEKFIGQTFGPGLAEQGAEVAWHWSWLQTTPPYAELPPDCAGVVILRDGSSRSARVRATEMARNAEVPSVVVPRAWDVALPMIRAANIIGAKPRATVAAPATVKVTLADLMPPVTAPAVRNPVNAQVQAAVEAVQASPLLDAVTALRKEVGSDLRAIRNDLAESKRDLVALRATMRAEVSAVSNTTRALSDAIAEASKTLPANPGSSPTILELIERGYRVTLEPPR